MEIEAPKKIELTEQMLQALEQPWNDAVPRKKRLTAYFVSLAFPPFGLIYAVRYYFSQFSDGKKVALYCVLLTIFVIVATTMLFNVIMSSAGVSLDQIQKINPNDIRSLVQ